MTKSGQLVGWNNLVLVLSMFVANSFENAAVSVDVPGSSNPWLAGMPDDTSSGRGRDFDYAPEHSPISVVGVPIVPDSALVFDATGRVNKGPDWSFSGPDGDPAEIAGKIVGGEHGMADLVAPKNALIGVFLGPEDPDFSPTPDGLVFASPSSIEFLELQPDLKQPFFIGDGFTRFQEQQRFIVPEGATRLFLGTMDGVGWYNNGGSFAVEVSPIFPAISVVNLRLGEGNSGESSANVVVRLSKPSNEAVSVYYETSAWTALQGFDYVSAGGTLTIPAGRTTGEIKVAIVADDEFEPDETFFLNLSEAANGILEVNRGTITIVNDDVQNLPPIVSLTSPSNEETFQAGAKVTVIAVASDPDGSISKVEFFASGSKLGEDREEPYTIDWLDLEPGEHVIFAQATDDFGVTVPSTHIRILVAAKPLPVPPTVSLSAPEGGSVFSAGSDIVIAAIAADSDGEVERVDFFANAGPVGTRTERPYQVQLKGVPAGTYELNARVTDDSGLEVISLPVSISVKDLSGDVAIVRPIHTSEVDVMKTYLSELGFSARVFEPSEITYDMLKFFQLVIWNDAGQSAPTLTGENLTALERTFARGIPLYFIGEHVASAANHLSDGDMQKWTALTRVSSSNEKGSVEFIQFPSSDLSHPIITGRFGHVDLFEYPEALPIASVSDSEAEVLGRSGTSDVLIAYPALVEEDLGDVRSVTQSFLVGRGEDVTSREERKVLFQNAVCWLLRCAECSLVNVWLDMNLSGETFKTGEPLTYSVNAYHAGECEATGVVLTNTLPPGTVFVKAVSGQGRVQSNGQDLTFHLGRLAKASVTTIDVTIIPVVAGVLSTRVRARINGPEVTLSDNTAELAIPVGGSVKPVVRIERVAGGSHELRLTSEVGRSYVIQSSSDLRVWSEIGRGTTGLWSLPLRGLDGVDPPWRFYRVMDE